MVKARFTLLCRKSFVGRKTRALLLGNPAQGRQLGPCLQQGCAARSRPVADAGTALEDAAQHCMQLRALLRQSADAAGGPEGQGLGIHVQESGVAGTHEGIVHDASALAAAAASGHFKFNAFFYREWTTVAQ